MISEENVRKVLRHPLVAVGSDSSTVPARESPDGEYTHPRTFGAFPRILSRYVREEGLLSLEEGVRKMSGLAAESLGLTDRGLIKEGMWADLVVFDPKRIKDTAGYEDPFKYPEGIEAVFCNGIPTLLQGPAHPQTSGPDFGEELTGMEKYRVAVVQDSPVVFDREATLEKVRELAGKAARTGARLVLFPEAFVSAYPRGLDFGARIGFRTPEGREDFRRYLESAVEVPGPAVDALAAAAKDFGVYLVIGVIERDGGTLYCTALFFSPRGEFLGKHRKLMPTASERLVWGFGDGSTMPVLQTELGRMGAVICWENYMPLMRMNMYAKGVQLYCAPTADSRPTWGGDHADHRPGRALLCPVLLPVPEAERLPRGLSLHPGGGPGGGAHVRGQPDRGPPGRYPGRTGL